MSLMKKRTLYLLIGIWALALAFLCAQLAMPKGSYVEVSINGTLVNRYDLNVPTTLKLNGGSNILVIEDGQAYMRYADCPDQICVKEGRVSLNGQCITCLPNKVVVSVVGDDDLDLFSR